MRAAMRRDDADAEPGRHLHGFVDGAHADDETKAVVAVKRGGDGGDVAHGERGARIDEPAPQALKVLRQKLQAVRINTAQIGAHQAVRDDRGIRWRKTMVQQKPAPEGFRFRRLDAHEILQGCHACHLMRQRGKSSRSAAAGVIG